MSASLKAKAEVAEQIAHGNLAIHVEASSNEDQLGRAMVTMNAKLSALDSDVKSLKKATLNGDLSVLANASKHEAVKMKDLTPFYLFLNII